MPDPYVAMFRADPLNLDRPIPNLVFFDMIAAECNCRAPKGCWHAEWCAIYGIYGEVCDAMLLYPRAEFSSMGGDRTCGGMMYRWLCSDYDNFHTGGEINGPAHWCEREHRFVDDTV